MQGKKKEKEKCYDMQHFTYLEFCIEMKLDLIREIDDVLKLEKFVKKNEYLALFFTLFFRQRLSQNSFAHGHEGLEVVGEDIVELVDAGKLAEPGPGVLLLARHVVDTVCHKGPVEVSLFLTRPAFALKFHYKSSLFYVCYSEYVN